MVYAPGGAIDDDKGLEFMKPAAENVPTASTTAHPLDHLVWHALTGPHAHFCEVKGDTARRFPPSVSSFGAVPEVTADNLGALGKLLGPDDHVVLFTVDGFTPPPGLEIVQRADIHQMTAATLAGTPGRTDFTVLGAADVDDMMALVDITKPGPFARRTHEMGRYIGLRDNGALVAMAGERMRLAGFTEVSAVCSHPDYRGRGLAADLVLAVAGDIVARGDVAFLHAFTTNVAAIKLYEKLGFRIRTTLQVTVLRLARDAAVASA